MEYGLEILAEEIEKFGMSEAFELLNSLVEKQFQNDLDAHLKVLDQNESLVAIEKSAAVTVAEFLRKLKDFRNCENQATELATCLIHPSNPIDIKNVYSRAQIKNRILTMPDEMNGKNISLLIISFHFLQDHQGMFGTASGISNLMKFYGNHFIKKEFWLRSGLGMPLIHSSINIHNENEIKRIPNICYDKLVDAIFIYEGWEAAKKFVINSLRIDEYARKLETAIQMGDPKTLVQEYFQRTGSPPPKYQAERIVGTAEHNPEFICKLHYNRFGSFVGQSETKNGAIRKLCEKIVVQLIKHPASKTLFSMIIADKINASKRVSDIKHVQKIPKNFYPISEAVEQYFDIKPDNFWMFQALTSKRQARYSRLPNNEVLSVLGATILDYFLWKHSGRRTATQKIVSRFCKKIANDLSLYESSKKILKNIDPKSDRLEDSICKAIIASMFLANQEAFFQKFPLFLEDWFNQNMKGVPELKIDFNDLNLERYDENFSYVMALQEYVQGKGMQLPSYTLNKTGPDHKPDLHASCQFVTKTAKGIGKNGKKAKNKAAFEMLKIVYQT